jgi:hypothetical protein
MTATARRALFLGGLLLLAGGTLQAAAHRPTFSATVDQWPYQLGAWATLAGSAVLVLVVPRWPVGPVAAAAAAVGSLLLAALAFSEATVNPALGDIAPRLLEERPGATMLVGMGVAIVGFAVGWLTFGVSLLRRSGRTGSAVAVVAASVVALAPMIPGPAVLGLALVWLATSTAPAPDLPEPAPSEIAQRSDSRRGFVA